MESSFKFVVYNGKKLRKKVRAIISDQNDHFLLIQPHSYESHMWSFVGGGVENGESNEVAILRELKEEVGIERIISLTPSEIKPWYVFSDKLKAARKAEYDGQIATIFLVQVQNNLPIKIQIEEIKAFRWASLAEVRELVTVPEQLEWFENVLKELLKAKAA